MDSNPSFRKYSEKNYLGKNDRRSLNLRVNMELLKKSLNEKPFIFEHQNSKLFFIKKLI